MPHDLTGRALKVGDEVLLRCTITDIGKNTDYCNCTVESVVPMYPGNAKTAVAINTRQCEKSGNVDHDETDVTQEPKPGESPK